VLKFKSENILNKNIKVIKKDLRKPKAVGFERKVSPARLAAFQVLLKIETEKSFSSVMLPIFEEKLQANDRGLCHELTLGTLRKQIYLDKIIETFSGNKLDVSVRIALRLGLYQLIFLDKIPAYSAINESVNLVHLAKKQSATGFVNAILRRATREKFELKFADETERISLETSHPRWLIERWTKNFGIEETEKIAVANNETPKLSFRFTNKTTEAIKTLLENEETKNDRKFLRELAENGKIYFQDEASQIVGQTIVLKEDERFLDVCAAPASKLSQVGSQQSAVGNKNLIVGGDLYIRRVETMKEICRNQGLKNVQCLQYNAEKSLPFADESFDVILLDAPCTGTGTIRHNPEIRYHLQEKDFAELFKKQLKILSNASKILKQNGRIIYSTCSLEVEENEQVIETFLSENNSFEAVKTNLPEKFLTDKGFARTFPNRDDVDGFFIAELVRKS
jgi:16S rRNA (cytosine967-C5)-methyltransferase